MKKPKIKTLKNKIILTLPPSVNQIYRYTSRGVYKTRSGKAWIDEAAWKIKADCEPVIRARVGLDAYFPNLRRRDLDNLLKCAMDALVRSGAIEDDNWTVLEYSHIQGHLDRENPRLEIIVEELGAREGLFK